jgi:hypothetical protein
MAWNRQPASLPDSLDFSQIVFRQINTCREQRVSDDASFVRSVEVLNDLLCAYWDDQYKKAITNGGKMTKMENPFDPNPNMNTQVEKARLVFRELLNLIHRSGFLPFREVEGVIELDVDE